MNGKYVCFIELFGDGNYNFIESVTDNNHFWICSDFAHHAKHFDTTDEAINWAKAHGLKDGEFGIRCYWIETKEETQ